MTASTGRAQAAVTLGKRSPAEQVQVPAPVAPIRYAIELASPVQDKFADFIAANRTTTPLEMVQPNVFPGQTAAICGAGPSLADTILAGIAGVDHVFACNSALGYLISNGLRVTGAVGIDQTPGLLREWADLPDVPYYVASSCDPALIQHLTAHGRRVVFFHNAVGLEDEYDLYCRTWPPTFMVGQGFTVCSRFIGVAQWMGFERVDVYGADCAFGPDDVTHANGEAADAAYRTPLIMTGKLPPSDRTWRTRPDMLRDAVHLAKRAQESAGRIRLMGDTLPVALLGKDAAYLDQVSRTLLPGETAPLAPPSTP